MIKAHIGLAGEFCFRLIRVIEGQEVVVRELSGSNHITDVGLDMIGIGEFDSNCVIGTGTSPEDDSDTALDNQIASVGFSQVQSNSNTYPGSPNFEAVRTKTWRFGAGTGTGIITEVGITADQSGIKLFSRALVRDEVGAPTSIEKQSFEILDVTHVLRLYPPLDDIETTVTNLANSAVHDVTIRQFGATSSNFWRAAKPAGGVQGVNNQANPQASGSGLVARTATSMGFPTAGATFGTFSQTVGSYGSGNHYIDAQLQITTGGFNGLPSGNIVSLYFATWPGTFQYEFDPPIYKDNQYTFRFKVRISWGRR